MIRDHKIPWHHSLPPPPSSLLPLPPTASSTPANHLTNGPQHRWRGPNNGNLSFGFLVFLSFFLLSISSPSFMLINCSLFLEIKNNRKIRPSQQQGQGGDTNNSKGWRPDASQAQVFPFFYYMISLHVWNGNDDANEVKQPPHIITITMTKSRTNGAQDVIQLKPR